MKRESPPVQQSDAARLDRLSEELRHPAARISHHERLDRTGTPEISDASFDELFERYQELADELGLAPGERLDAQPGAEHTDGFATVAHKMRMLSLEKLSLHRRDSKGQPVPLGQQLQAWYDRRVKDLGLEQNTRLGLVVEPKIDGISISLLYDRGELVRAVTGETAPGGT